MADVLYPKGKEAILNGDIDFNSDDIRAVFLDDTYTYDAAHDFLNDVSAKVLGTAVQITSPTIALGVFDGASTTLIAVPLGIAKAILIYKHTGTESTSALIAYLDGAPELPLTTVGSDIIIAWDSGANKIFAL